MEMEFAHDDDSNNSADCTSENIRDNNLGHVSTTFSCTRARKRGRFTHKHQKTIYVPEPQAPLSVTSDRVTQDQETRQLESDVAYSKPRNIIMWLSGTILIVLVSCLILLIITVASRHDGAGTDRAELDERIKSLEDENKRMYSNLEKLSTELKNLIRNLTEIVESDCGGIIQIPTTKASYLLYYKLNRTYDVNEKCLWTLENTERSIRSQLTIKVELISNGFKGNTGLFAFKWNRDVNLTSEELTSGKEHVLTAEGLYVSFTSDSDSESSTGTGFLLKLTVIKSELKTYGSNLFYRTLSGSYTVSSYNHDDQISIVINTMTLVTFTVIHTDTEPGEDVLYIYEIKKIGRFEELKRLSGRSTTPVSLSTINPILAIFSSDSSLAVKGFSLSWV